ncbi:NAD(P)-binding protein [Apiospora saccharicola]
MPSYVITGVSKGLGFETLRILSKDPQNTIVGLVRDKFATERAVAEQLALSGGQPSNIHILHGDLTDYASLSKAATETAAITGGKVDYLIANGGYVPQWDAYDPIGELAEAPEKVSEELGKLYQTNIAGNMQLFRYFLPLVLKGDVKKVVAISSGLADLKSLNGLGLTNSPLYALNKAGLNVLMAKYSAQYKKDGVLFVSICPGMVDVGHFDNVSPPQREAVKAMEAKFKAAIPGFPGPMKPDVAMQNVIDLWEKASFENGDAGAFLSSRGTKYGY